MHAANQELQGAELRASERITLVLRTAKLISQAGEFFCIVRDVSTNGTKLCFFHEPPSEEFVLLELANGNHYALQQVWTEDCDSGYRFTTPVDVDDFIEEQTDYPRRPIRLRLNSPLLLTADGEDYSCRMINISQQGMCIEAPVALPTRMRCRVEVDGLPIRFAHTCWRKRKFHGLALQTGFRFDELAQYVHAIQPPVARLVDAIKPSHFSDSVRQAVSIG